MSTLTLHELAAVQGSLELHGDRAHVPPVIIRRLVEEIFQLRELSAACLHDNWQDDPAQVALRDHLFPPPPVAPPAPDLDGRLQIAHILALANRPLTADDLARVLRRDPRPDLQWMEYAGQIQATATGAWVLRPAPCG